MLLCPVVMPGAQFLSSASQASGLCVPALCSTVHLNIWTRATDTIWLIFRGPLSLACFEEPRGTNPLDFVSLAGCKPADANDDSRARGVHECARAHRKTGATAVKYLPFPRSWISQTPQRVMKPSRQSGRRLLRTRVVRDDGDISQF